MIKILQSILKKFGLSVIRYNAFHSDDKYLDKKEFSYIMMINNVYEKIQNIPGHIIELGVARGRNAILFGNLIHAWNDLSRKYYGFDTFSGYTEEDLKHNPKLNPDNWIVDDQKVQERIINAGYQKNVKLIKGDIKETVPNFISKNPDLKIALVYVDCNAYLPAINALNSLKDNLMKGAIICIDEKRDGGESKALIEFAKENNLEVVKDTNPFSLPAYINYQG